MLVRHWGAARSEDDGLRCGMGELGAGVRGGDYLCGREPMRSGHVSWYTCVRAGVCEDSQIGWNGKNTLFNMRVSSGQSFPTIKRGGDSFFFSSILSDSATQIPKQK